MEFKKRIVLMSVVSGILPSAYLVSRYSNFKSPNINRSNIKVIVNRYLYILHLFSQQTISTTWNF